MEFFVTGIDHASGDPIALPAVQAEDFYAAYQAALREFAAELGHTLFRVTGISEQPLAGNETGRKYGLTVFQTAEGFEDLRPSKEERDEPLRYGPGRVAGDVAVPALDLGRAAMTLPVQGGRR